MPLAGEGPQPALGMIVGEAPGREEEKEGRPFVGKSGRLLDSALRSIGVERSSVYITNVVKEVPLDSEGRIRRPHEEEVIAWLPILEGEIQNTAPIAILALGRTAQRALVPGVPEEAIPFGSIIGNVYVAWHPAYVLRQGASQYIFSDWLAQIRRWAEDLHAA